MSSLSLETALNQGIYSPHYTPRGLSSQDGANWWLRSTVEELPVISYNQL